MVFLLKTYKKFGTAQDHKRVYEGDNGGHGCHSSRLENEKLNDKILKILTLH